MTEPTKDEFDEKAEELLPCNQDTATHNSEPYEHPYSCPAYHVAAAAVALREQAERIKALEEERDTYKRIAERNHKANMMPCPQCGYQPKEIKARAKLEGK